jgi:hypothetical protein
MDPDGRDSTQRAAALAKAQEYVAKNDNGKGNSYEMGAKGQPGHPVDCSGLVVNGVKAGGEDNPNQGTKNGVANIADNLPSVDPKDVVPGNIVILAGEHHTGFVSLVDRDKDGNIVNEKMIDSGGDPESGKSGPRTSDIIKNGKAVYWGQRVDGYRKFDTIPDSPGGGSTTSGSSTTAGKLVLPTVPNPTMQQDNTRVVHP